LKPAEPVRLPAARAAFRADVRALGIASSADVPPSNALGDARGAAALALALETRAPGYHAFACGVEGPRRLDHVAALARGIAPRSTRLRDWVYVHAFSTPDRPRAIELPAGDGARLKTELAALLRNLREDLPKAFREEAFDEEKARVIGAFEAQQREHQRSLEELAERSGFAVVVGPQGNLALIPLVDGKPVENEEQFRRLGEQRIAALEAAREKLAREIRDRLERHRDERHRLDEEIRGIEREFAGRIVKPRLRALAARFGNAELEEHLGELGDHLLRHLDPFRGEPPPSLPFPFAPAAPEDPFAIYEVNVVVDNSRTEVAPVVVVDSPTYKNLFGTIDRSIDRFGQVTTDFRKIHAGALLEADGGVVVLNAEDALVEPFVWRVLRRALRSGRVEIEAYDPFVGFTPAGIRPEPVRVETKVVMLGPRWMFEMLRALDDEFPNLFKVLADFAPIVERTPDTTRALLGRVSRVLSEGGLPELDAGALDALVELAVREAGDRRRLALGSERVLDIAREAAARGRSAGRERVERGDVLEAMRERVHRLDRIERDVRDAIARGILLVDLDGARIGQVNALSVLELGGHVFGQPSRVTATVGLGPPGIVSVDRETRLSGSIHDKGVLILEGFLRDRFAHRRPLSLRASLVFEQSYGRIEGDSASLPELLAILSRLGEFPLRQDLAVTGSINQNGEVQAIGGINEKIEGFFDVCRARGLSGAQGVVFPASNEEHLALREDVVAALEVGKFALYPVRTIEQALEVFTGRAAAPSTEPDSLYAAIDAGLGALTERLRHALAPAGPERA
jgi:predicted ATP-dependent protease